MHGVQESYRERETALRDARVLIGASQKRRWRTLIDQHKPVSMNTDLTCARPPNNF